MIAIIAVVLAAIFGGGIPVFAKIGLAVIPPFAFTFFRFFIALLAILPLFFREKPKISRNVWKIIALSLLLAGNVTFFAFGIRLTTATVSQMLYAVVPVIAAIFSYFLLGETFTARKIAGLCIGLAGVMMLILLPVIGLGGVFSGTLRGNLIIMSAVLVFSLYTVLSKQFQKSYSPVYLTTMSAFTIAVVLLVLSFSDLFIYNAWMADVRLPHILSTMYVGIFGGVVYYLLYQYAIKHGSPVIASMTMFIQPFATFMWASLLLSERMTIGIFAGGALAITGAALVTLNGKKS